MILLRRPSLYWSLLVFSFYAPLLTLRAVFPDDLLDSELVYNRAIGALWRGDSSIVHAFLVGHVPMLALSRLTQPLMVVYALLRTQQQQRVEPDDPAPQERPRHAN